MTTERNSLLPGSIGQTGPSWERHSPESNDTLAGSSARQ